MRILRLNFMNRDKLGLTFTDNSIFDTYLRINIVPLKKQKDIHIN